MILSIENKLVKINQLEKLIDSTKQELKNEIGTGSGSGSVTVDTTLAKSGQAADSKTVGDAIKSLSETKANQSDVDKLSEEIENQKATNAYIEDGFLIFKNADGTELFRADLSGLSTGKKHGALSVDVTEITIAENGTATFSVKIAEEIGTNQIVTITASDDVVTVSPSTLIFSKSNYNSYQTVTVKGINDDDLGDRRGTITLASNGEESVIVAYIVKDDDSVEFVTVSAVADFTANIQSQYNWLRSYDGSEENVIVSKTMDNNKVAWLKKNSTSFTSKKTTKHLRFEDGVVGDSFSLYEDAIIESVQGLPSITMVVNIDGCSNLKLVNGQEGYITLGNSSYMRGLGIKNLNNVRIDPSVTNMSSCFSANQQLESADIDIPDSVTNISNMFYNCTKLKKVPAITRHNFTSVQGYCRVSGVEEITVTDKEFADMFYLLNWSYSSGTRSMSGLKSGITFKMYSDSVAFDQFRTVMMDNKYLWNDIKMETLDKKEFKNISFWGDSLTKLSTTGSEWVSKLYDLIGDDSFFFWNLANQGLRIAGEADAWFDTRPDRYDDIAVIWVGTNNTTTTYSADVAEIKERYVDKISSGKYIVLGMATQHYSEDGEMIYAKQFGEHYLNIHDYIIKNWKKITGLNEGEVDTTPTSAGNIPKVLLYDNNHFNAYGGQCIAQAVKEKLESLGYI